MPWSDGLDPATPAFRIAADTGPRVRVLAGPGTGKSFAIKRRITRLLEEGVAPESILAVTFTRMSAADLVRDIRSLGVAGAEDVVARTLHSECFRILGRNAVIQITGRHPRPLAAFEFEPMLADLRVAASGRNKKETRKLVGAYVAAWARLQHETPGVPRSAEDQAFEDALVDWLRFHRAMLIGELVPFAYQYLRDNPSAPELSTYSHVLVDEYQDLNKAEQEVAALLATAGHLAIVGDDDQSIYTFKNAHRVGIIEFPTMHAGTHNHTMDLCQRCPSLVVSMANALISRNASRPRPCRSLRELPANGGGIVEVFHFASHDDEISHLADRVSGFVADGVPPGQIIVLCQSRKYIRGLYDSLRTSGVSTEFCYQESQFDDEQATERMAILSLAGNLNDRVCLRYLIGFGSGDWRTSQWGRIRSASETEGKSPWNILVEMTDGTRPDTHCRQAVVRFRNVRDQVMALGALQGVDLLNGWLPSSQLYSELHALASMVVAETPECGPDELAEAILETIEQPDVPDEVTAVRIMSLHKSKGLSANVVVIAGCVEGLIPRTPDTDLTDAEQRESLEESRRLFFVGITRVKAAPSDGRAGHLILSSSRNLPTAIAMQSGVAGRLGRRGTFTTITSHFMRELGPDCPAATTPARVVSRNE
jgi:superfamily I DNA/RNA helicase